MTYDVNILERAAKEIERIASRERKRILAAIAQLADAPRPHGARKLADHEQLYRIRVGDYRIIYTIRDDRLIVVVVTVGHRREVYEQLSRLRIRELLGE